jgi:acylphosphatase
MKICLRCYVSGRVQGVWYRAYTRDRALQLNITGYARNLPDGRVEVLACGEENAVTQLREWLQVGPPRAQVTEVQWESVAVEDHASFTTG